MRSFYDFENGRLLPAIRQMSKTLRHNASRSMGLYSTPFRRAVFQSNTRLSISYITDVSQRIRKQLIRNVHIEWNYDSFSQYLLIRFEVTSTRSQELEYFTRFIKDVHAVQQCYETTGDWPLLCFGMFPSIAEFENFLDRVKSRMPHLQFKYQAYPKQHKFEFEPSFEYLTDNDGIMTTREYNKKQRRLKDDKILDIRAWSSR